MSMRMPAPVKDELKRVQRRHGLRLCIVSNGRVCGPHNPLRETRDRRCESRCADCGFADPAGRGDIVHHRRYRAG